MFDLQVVTYVSQGPSAAHCAHVEQLPLMSQLGPPVLDDTVATVTAWVDGPAPGPGPGGPLEVVPFEAVPPPEVAGPAPGPALFAEPLPAEVDVADAPPEPLPPPASNTLTLPPQAANSNNGR
jgi:hypothetical protein